MQRFVLYCLLLVGSLGCTIGGMSNFGAGMTAWAYASWGFAAAMTFVGVPLVATLDPKECKDAA